MVSETPSIMEGAEKIRLTNSLLCSLRGMTSGISICRKADLLLTIRTRMLNRDLCRFASLTRSCLSEVYPSFSHKLAVIALTSLYPYPKLFQKQPYGDGKCKAISSMCQNCGCIVFTCPTDKSYVKLLTGASKFLL